MKYEVHPTWTYMNWTKKERALSDFESAVRNNQGEIWIGINS